jgi:hypothetical protein
MTRVQVEGGPAKGEDHPQDMAALAAALRSYHASAHCIQGHGTDADPYVLGATADPMVGKFIELAEAGGWLLEGFDWQSWGLSKEGTRLLHERAAVHQATAQQLCKTFTALVRQDRVVEGALAGALQSGLILALAERAARLMEDGRVTRR